MRNFTIIVMQETAIQRISRLDVYNKSLRLSSLSCSHTFAEQIASQTVFHQLHKLKQSPMGLSDLSRPLCVRLLLPLTLYFLR